MKEEIKKFLAVWLRDNRDNQHKINLIQYMQERICLYASQESTHAEQIKGMNRLLRDILNLPSEMLENK